jgi:hypothetical protein
MRRSAFAPEWSEWDAFELGQYIDSFKSSSDRARGVFYVVLTVSILIFTASWNLNSASWSQLRLRKWARHELRLSEDPLPASRTATEQAIEEKIRRLYLDHYPETFVDEMVLVDLPLLGVSVDVNDFGLLGGITLMLLMTLLVLSIMRMDENLYLSIFKIRRLHEEERRQDGESRANLLYHALAMGQVLFHPPTLARWRVRRSHGLAPKVLRFVLFVPFLVHAWTVYGNARTLYIAVWYREGVVPVYRMLAQFFLLVLIGALVLISCGYVRAMEQRWRNAFFFINPRQRFIDPPSLWHRLRVRSRWSAEEKLLRRRLQKALVDKETVVIGELRPGDLTMTLHHVVPWREKKVAVAALDLMKAARREAERRAPRMHLRHLGITGMRIVRRNDPVDYLDADIQWFIAATPLPDAGTSASTLAESSLQSARFDADEREASRGYY